MAVVKPASKQIRRVPGPDFRRERRSIKDGCEIVAGVDEAGRGPLAGPVVAAAVVLNPRKIPKGLDDSKALTPERREALYLDIMEHAEVAFVSASPARIDRDDIRKATLWAMCAAVSALPRAPGRVFVDGKEFPNGLPCPAEAVIDGDAKLVSIAAASIIAKVTRDRLMRRLAQSVEGYGFERHVGYGTREHRAALARLGPTCHHRRSFAPVRLAWEIRSGGEPLQKELALLTEGDQLIS
ncbi:ribonuclease HII [Terrihabitans sp. B22-R8]|uniref:ribonuclease HII n=1 Tax=Terrihabitans sp. B22-R8 TaxID=3425128 RepID=UPI00403D42E3